MVSTAYLARRFLILRALRGGLVAGSLLDLAAAWAAVWRPTAAGQLLRVTLPDGALYLRLTGLLLVVLALLSLVAASDVRRYSAVIVIVGAGRVAAAALLFLGGPAAPSPWLAAAEAALGLVVLTTWRLVRR